MAKFTVRAGTALTLVLCLAPSAAAPAVAADDIESTAGLIASLAPAAPVVNGQHVGTDVRLAVDDLSVHVPRDLGAGSIEISSSETSATAPLRVSVLTSEAVSGASASFDLAEAVDGTLVGTGGGVNTAVQIIEDGSVRVLNVIESSSAPTSFKYLIEIPSGASVALDEDGFVTVLDGNGDLIGGVAPAWATDVLGNSVPTRYRLTVEAAGVLLTQEVDHTAEGVTYPVVADPYLGKKLVQSVAITTRDSRGKTAVVTPTVWGRATSNNTAAIGPMWSEYKAKVSSTYETTQMYWQLFCHWQNVPLKSTWNLDTWVVRSSYLDSVTHACN